jgi:hypothetical protein
MNLNQAADIIVTTFKTQIVSNTRFAIELESGPGIGKSSIVHQLRERLAKELGESVGLIEFFLSTCEAPDVAGFHMPDRDEDGIAVTRTTRAPWAPGKDAPKYGIVFLDEFRQAPVDVQKPAAELLLNGRVGETSLPITWFVIAASNRETDRSGVQRELAFISNRRMLLRIEPNLDAWVEWAEKSNVHPLAIAFAKFKPSVVFQDRVPDKSGPFCTPRTLVKTSYLIGQLDMALFTEVAQGYLGEGAGAEFVAFLRVAEQLPTFEQIIADPKRTPVPDRPDAAYAAVQMLAHCVTEETGLKAFEYLIRMPKEYQVVGLRTVFAKARSLLTKPEYQQWIRENKDLVLAAAMVSRK